MECLSLFTRQTNRLRDGTSSIVKSRNILKAQRDKLHLHITVFLVDENGDLVEIVMLLLTSYLWPAVSATDFSFAT